MPKRIPEMLCRWNVFEPMLRDALRAYAEKRVSAERTLEAIDAYQAAATSGEHVLEESDEGWERICWDSYQRHLEHKRFAQRGTNDKLAT